MAFNPTTTLSRPALADLKALLSRPETVVVETGQAAGVWQWVAGSATTADDALVVACTSGAAGRYKRIYDGDMYATWFGASPSATGEENVTAINALIVASAAARCEGIVSRGTYEISGEIDTVSNLQLVFDNAVLVPVGWSVSGSIITNLDTSASAATIQENIQIEGLQMDFSSYPASPIGTAQSGTTSTITLAAGETGAIGNSTIAARLALGYAIFIRLLSGTGSGAATYSVTGFNTSTKVMTISTTWGGATPDNTTVYQWGWNDNAIGFTGGVTDVRVLRTRVTNLPSDMLSNGGGKGINFEQGVDGGLIDDVFVEGAGRGCIAAVFVQGRSGVWGNGSERNSILIQVKNVFARNCGAAVAIGGADTTEPPSGNPDQQLVIVDGVTFHNCGHMPNRFVGTDQQKGAPILLFRAQNVVIKNVTGFNDSTYPETSPGYPTDYSARVGYGLTGPIGAVVWGWGRNITVDGITYNGDADSLVRINRARVIGEDAAAQGVAGEVTNVISFEVTGLRHWGTVDNVVAVDSTASMRVADANLLLNVEAEPGTVTTGLTSNMTGYVNTSLNIYDRTTDTRVEGTASQIQAAGNTAATFPAATNTQYSLQVPTYLRVGSNTVPTNVKNGDITGARLSLGGSALTGQIARVGGTVTGAPTVYGVFNNVSIGSAAITSGSYFYTAALTSNAVFTVNALSHFRATQLAPTFDATVNNQYGVFIEDTLIGATNNYGVYSDIAAATDDWNFFANGTANNAFAGNTRFGGVTAPVVAVDVTGAISLTGALTSTLATGTAPFTVASTTVVGNLNVSQLLGGTWAIPGTIGSTTPNSGSFTTVTASGDITAAAGSTSAPSIKSPTDETGFSFTSAALMNYVTAGTLRTQYYGTLIRHSSVVGVCWASGGAGLAADVGLSRKGPNILGVGTGAVGSTEGTLRAGALAANGSDFTITAANSVSPTSPNRTITISYGGTTYYLHAKTTNN
jgi:hypothetical protein